MSAAKPPPSLEDQMASLAAQMEKLAAAVAATKGDSAKITKISDSLVTLQGAANSGRQPAAI
jgi:DNA-binding GntR family transcriptional regulator